MSTELFNVVTFESTHHAIRGEKYFKEIGLVIKTIPTPREITASCGLSIRFDINDIDKVKEIIAERELAIEGIYEITKENFKKTAKKIDL